MKNKYCIYIRGKHSGGKVWWCQDNKTGQRESLRTTDKNEATRLQDLKNQPHLIIGSMRDAGLSKMDGLAMDEFFQREARKEICTFLPALADQDAARAAKIARILKVDGLHNENQPPTA